MTRRSPGSTMMAALVSLATVLAAVATWAAGAGNVELALDLAAGAAAVAFVAVLLAALRRPPVLDVVVVADELGVRFGGWDVVWSLRREVRIPLRQIASVRVYRPEDLWSGWWHRRLNAVIPGTIKAGWFGGPDGRELWDVRAGSDVIDVRLAPGSPTPDSCCRFPIRPPRHGS